MRFIVGFLETKIIFKKCSSKIVKKCHDSKIYDSMQIISFITFNVNDYDNWRFQLSIRSF